MKRKYKLSLLCFGLLACVHAIAQLNESDTLKLQLRATVSGNYQQGNVALLAVRSKFDFTVAPVKQFVFKSQNSSLYQEFGNRKADNDLFSRNYLYWKPQNKVYPFGIAYISSNFRRKIDTRFFAGAGVTYQFVQKQFHVLKLSASVVYETNRFNGTVYNKPEYNGSNQINLWRGTLYAGGWNYLFNRKLRLYYDMYWQPAFNNSNNYRTQYDVGADIPLWKGLNLSILYMFTHEHVVISNIKQQDKILSFGFSYNFKQKHK
jgi:Protein of unknown function, DUF481